MKTAMKAKEILLPVYVVQVDPSTPEVPFSDVHLFGSVLYARVPLEPFSFHSVAAPVP